MSELKKDINLYGKHFSTPIQEITKQAVDILPVKIKIDQLEKMDQFRINYLPDPEKIFIINNILQTEEGKFFFTFSGKFLNFGNV